MFEFICHSFFIALFLYCLLIFLKIIILQCHPYYLRFLLLQEIFQYALIDTGVRRPGHRFFQGRARSQVLPHHVYKDGVFFKPPTLLHQFPVVAVIDVQHQGLALQAGTLISSRSFKQVGKS